jgi:hypothetical protein
VRIPASGWRGSPWVVGIGAIVPVLIVAGMALAILGLPGIVAAAIPFATVYVVVVAAWLPFELMAVREVDTTPSGVWFRSRIKDPFLRWDKLEVSQRIRRPSLNALSVFEPKDGWIRRRVPIVTRDQARATVEWMDKTVSQDFGTKVVRRGSE